MVERKEYLDQLWAWKDEQQIKVVTGIRRCGKSVLLEQYQQRLLANGVTPEQIISINFENLDYEPLKDYMKLYNYLKERLCADKMTYIFLDEVQEVPSFEKVVDSLYIRDYVDVYITGSNAYMLSSELATLLSGRYTEIKMLPLSFREYMVVTGMAKEEAFAEFMKTGGIPYVAVMNRTDEKIDQYLEGIYNTVIVKDIEQRQARREKEGGKRKITDIALLKTIARYLASVIGNPVSMKSITDYLTSAGRKVSQNTVSDYVEALTERAGKKSQYVRERIVLTLPVSNRQGIFLPIFRTKTLKKNKKSVKIRTISSKIRINQYKQGIIIIDVFLYFLHQKSPKCSFENRRLSH